MIYEKLLKFQEQDVVLTKDGENPHFKSEYVTLNEVLDKVKGPLNVLKVVIIQEPQADGLLTRLVDTEDQTEVSGFMPWVGADNAQKMLACNTYFRRGTLVSLLGLRDTDDDGNLVSAAKVPSRGAQRPAGPVERDDEPFPSKSTTKKGKASSEDESLEELAW